MFEQLAAAYEAALAAIDDASAQASLRRKLAEVLDKKLGRGAEAINQMQAATGGALPEDLPSLEAMERLLREQNRQAELAEVLYAMAARLPADQLQRKQACLVELGGLCQTVLDDKARAVRDILGVSDYGAFLERSGYAAQLAR